MSNIRETTEAVIRFFKTKIHGRSFLASVSGTFEIKHPPNVILTGPILTENKQRRCFSPFFLDHDREKGTCTKTQHPHYYYLDFNLTITCNNQADLIDLVEKATVELHDKPLIEVPNIGKLPFKLTTPIGNLSLVNLSNLFQSSGQVRVVDCPVESNIREKHKLILEPKIIFYNQTENSKKKGKITDKELEETENPYTDFLSIRMLSMTKN